MPEPIIPPRALEGFPGREALAAPSPWFFTDEDDLQLTAAGAITGMTLTCRGVLMTPDGALHPFQFGLAATSDRTTSSTATFAGAGWLLHATVQVTAGAPLEGQCYALLSRVRGHSGATVRTGRIAADYVTATRDLAYPASPIRSALDGQGALRSVAGTAPAAGAELSDTVPTGARWELVAVQVKLTTAIATGTRQPTLIIDDGATILTESENPGTLAPSSNVTFFWAAGAWLSTVIAGAIDVAGLPVGLRLLAGWRIRSTTANLAAADQWSAPQYLVREWLEL